MQGRPFRCRPYRFRAHNGDYLHLETDWSCFVNPWSRRLEFVIGKHTVLRGPADVDVFKWPDGGGKAAVGAEGGGEEGAGQEAGGAGALKEDGKSIREEIKLMLTDTVARSSHSDPLAKSSSRRWVMDSIHPVLTYTRYRLAPSLGSSHGSCLPVGLAK